MEMDCQFISIYGKLVKSQTASFSREDISRFCDRVGLLISGIFQFYINISINISNRGEVRLQYFENIIRYNQ